MGTRNLTVVISNKEPKIAQYGQWDGYPDGVGSTILEFLRTTDIEAFKEKLKSVHFFDSKKEKEKDKFLKSIGSKNGWIDLDQAAQLHTKYPFISRDIGGKILELIMAANDSEIWVNNSTDFATDSLFCEWAYVIDLDKGVFEIYKGFNTKPLTEADRFYYLQKEIKERDEKYYPVKLIKSYLLSDLPEEEVFLKQVNKSVKVK